MKIKIDVGNSDELMNFRNGNANSECVKHLSEHFYVITCISNCARFSRRYQLYKEFAHRMHLADIKLFTVECAFGERNFEVTHADNPMNLQLRTNSEMWHKENMINLGIARLPSSWKYICWIDADISFDNKHWVSDTIHALQHYDVVQLFSQALDLGPNSEIMMLSHSFCYSYISGKNWNGKKYGGNWHPGYAWGCTRKGWQKMGGLYEISILGSGDHNMILALIGKYEDSIPSTMHENYKNSLKAWQENVIRNIKTNIGYVPGIIKHYFHGKKKNRKYVERWDILKKHKFDPLTDIKKDWQGLWQLNDNKPGLRDDLRAYFRVRNEDSNDNGDD
jgi:hypothetical protein